MGDATVAVEVDLVELAEDWLAARRSASRASNLDAAVRSRRNDLCRWGRAALTARGAQPAERPGGRFDLAEDFGHLQLRDLNVELLVRSLSVMRASYDPATARRSLATMRSFGRWLVRRGHLEANPADDEDLTVPDVTDPGAGALPFHAFEAGEVVAMLEGASASPPPGVRAAWPARDVAVLRVLEGCGVRVGELCGLWVADADLDALRPMLHVVRGAKGMKRRDVPIPQRTVVALRRYLTERADLAAAGHPGMGLAERSPLFVRPGGRPLNQPFVDRMIRRVAATAGVTLRGDAAAHGFRHFYGMSLALRGVPVPVIAEAMGHADTRTTSIYMRAVGRHLGDALEDAGWLT